MDEELILFVEKAHRLETSAFWKWVMSRKRIPDMEQIIAGNWLAHDGLKQDSMDAFCLNLRFLIQPRDGFHIDKILELSRSWDDKYKQYRDDIEISVHTLKAKLAEKSLANIHKDHKSTNFELFEVIFYGGIAHANPDKRRMFTEITSSGLFSYFVFQAFIGVLVHYRNCIQRLAYNIVQYLSHDDCKS